MFLGLDAAKPNVCGEREPGTGSANEIIDDLKRLFELGFTRIIVRDRGSSAVHLEANIDRFVTEIMPRV